MIKKFIISLFILVTLSLTAQNYFNKPPKSIPAQHAWVFNEETLTKILIEHLKNQGTNVPTGQIKINGLESHYDWAGNQRVELVIMEK